MPTARDNVVFSLVEPFNDAAPGPERLVNRTDFLNHVTDMVREQIPDALRPGDFTIMGDLSGHDPLCMVMVGDKEKIERTLRDIFYAAQQHGAVILSQPLEETAVGKELREFWRRPPASELVLTTTTSLYDVVIREGFRVPTRKL